MIPQQAPTKKHEETIVIVKSTEDTSVSKSIDKITNALLKKHDMVIFAANTDAFEVILSSNSIAEPVFAVQVKPGRTLIKSVQRLLLRGKLGVAFHA